MQYKLIALDVDGTLLNSEGILTERNKNTIQKVYEMGIKVVLCSGRSLHQMEQILRDLDIEKILITHNGGATIHSVNKNVLNECPFNINDVLPLLNYCRSNRIHFAVCTAFNTYVETINDYLQNSYKKYVLLDDVLSIQEPIIKLIIDDFDKVDGWQTIDIPLQKLQYGPYMEVLHLDVNKGNALSKLAAHFGIQQNKIIAIGDYYNDMSMIQYAGLGIAMGNAPDDIKQCANDTTRSNNEDGVHYALNKYCLR
jgi:Cof subfamily protein (haloacid dehalogenase superfamily)